MRDSVMFAPDEYFTAHNEKKEKRKPLAVSSSRIAFD